MARAGALCPDDAAHNVERRITCPKRKNVEAALLEVLVELGGQGRPRDIHPLVIKKLAQSSFSMARALWIS